MASTIGLREFNRNSVYRCIHGSDGISRQEIAAQTGLSIPTVTQNLNDLEEKGLITSDGVFESNGGRRARVIRCVENAAFSIGVDITCNHMTVVVLNALGKIVCGGQRERLPYENTEAYYRTVSGRIKTLLKMNRVEEDRILGIGISLPCIVDREKNRVTYGRVIEAPEDLADRFRSLVPWQTELFNDANAAGTAETWQNREKRTVFYLMLSNSVGGAVVLNSGIYLGDHCRSSEIGHVKIVPNGRKCYCGQRGCVNTYCSALLLSDHTGGDLEAFFRKVDSKDPESCDAFSEYLDRLAVTVINLRMLFDCSIILGGYVGAYMDRYMDLLKERLEILNPYEAGADYVEACTYRREASAVGAGLPFISRFISEI